MPSVKKIFYTKKVYTDGTSPVIIQIISGKKIKRKVIFSILPEQWDAKEKQIKLRKHPDYEKLNADLDDEYNRVKRLIRDNPDIDIDYAFEKELKKDVLSFRQIADLYLKSLKSGWSIATYNALVNKFLNIIGEPNIKLSEITNKHVLKWMNGMRALGNKDSTMNTNVRVIRFVSEFAHKNKLDKKPDALYDFKQPVGTKSFKERLTVAEFEAIKTVELATDSKLSEIRDMFLLAVYLRGIRISDIIMLKQAAIKDGRFIYRSQKNDKQFDIKLIPDAAQIVNKYLNGNEYLFSFFRWKYNEGKTVEQNKTDLVFHVKSITANINGKLNKIAEKAKINKKISTHIARHTFARMALEKINDTNITMDLLGHSSMKVHEAYIREISKTKDLDDAADNIFG